MTTRRHWVEEVSELLAVVHSDLPSESALNMLRPLAHEMAESSTYLDPQFAEIAAALFTAAGSAAVRQGEWSEAAAHLAAAAQSGQILMRKNQAATGVYLYFCLMWGRAAMLSDDQPGCANALASARSALSSASVLTAELINGSLEECDELLSRRNGLQAWPREYEICLRISISLSLLLAEQRKESESPDATLNLARLLGLCLKAGGMGWLNRDLIDPLLRDAILLLADGIDRLPDEYVVGFSSLLISLREKAVAQHESDLAETLAESSRKLRLSFQSVNARARCEIARCAVLAFKDTLAEEPEIMMVVETLDRDLNALRDEGLATELATRSYIDGKGALAQYYLGSASPHRSLELAEEALRWSLLSTELYDLVVVSLGHVIAAQLALGISTESSTRMLAEYADRISPPETSAR